MSLYENDVIERRESEERGDGIGEISSSRRIPCFEASDGDDASDAKSTSSSSAIGLDLFLGVLMVDHPILSAFSKGRPGDQYEIIHFVYIFIYFIFLPKHFI